MKKVRSVYITEEMEKKIKDIAVITGWSFNKVVEQLLDRALEEEGSHKDRVQKTTVGGK